MAVRSILEVEKISTCIGKIRVKGYDLFCVLVEMKWGYHWVSIIDPKASTFIFLIMAFDQVTTHGGPLCPTL